VSNNPGRVLRWIDQLTDGQIFTLVARLSTAVATPLWNPELIRAILRDFARDMPKANP